MLTFRSPSHHDSACSGLTRDQLGISLAAHSMAAAAMHDGQYARKLASETKYIYIYIYIGEEIIRVTTQNACLHYFLVNTT